MVRIPGERLRGQLCRDARGHAPLQISVSFRSGRSRTPAAGTAAVVLSRPSSASLVPSLVTAWRPAASHPGPRVPRPLVPPPRAFSAALQPLQLRLPSCPVCEVLQRVLAQNSKTLLALDPSAWMQRANDPETIGFSTEDGGQGWGVTRKGGCQPTRNVTVRLYCVCPGPPGGGGRGRGPGGKFRLKLRLKPGDVCSRSNWASKPAKVTHRGARGRGGARMFENDIPVQSRTVLYNSPRARALARPVCRVPPARPSLRGCPRHLYFFIKCLTWRAKDPGP